MRAFLSWSGQKSRQLATALKPSLETILPDVSVWMSEHDLAAGSPWNTSLHVQLRQADFGILCLTPENVAAPWILYEAGALAIATRVGCVVPYLLGLNPVDLKPPLSLFQSAEVSRLGTWKMVRSLNQARETPEQEPALLDRYEQEWPRLADQLGLGVNWQTQDDVVILAPGPQQFHHEPETRVFRELLRDHIQRGHRKLIVDLSRVETITSTGLSFIFVILSASKRQEAEVAMIHVSPRILEALEMLRVISLLAIFPTKEEALGWLDRPRPAGEDPS